MRMSSAFVLPRSRRTVGIYVFIFSLILTLSQSSTNVRRTNPRIAAPLLRMLCPWFGMCSMTHLKAAGQFARCVRL
jgi:hypothetical protein